MRWNMARQDGWFRVDVKDAVHRLTLIAGGEGPIASGTLGGSVLALAAARFGSVVHEDGTPSQIVYLLACLEIAGTVMEFVNAL